MLNPKFTSQDRISKNVRNIKCNRRIRIYNIIKIFRRDIIVGRFKLGRAKALFPLSFTLLAQSQHLEQQPSGILVGFGSSCFQVIVELKQCIG